jgi:hypothetical protein
MVRRLAESRCQCTAEVTTGCDTNRLASMTPGPRGVGTGDAIRYQETCIRRPVSARSVVLHLQFSATCQCFRFTLPRGNPITGLFWSSVEADKIIRLATLADFATQTFALILKALFARRGIGLRPSRMRADETADLEGFVAAIPLCNRSILLANEQSGVHPSEAACQLTKSACFSGPDGIACY